MTGTTAVADRKTVPMAVKVSEETAALVDAARGKMTRSAWLQQAIGTALGETSRHEALARNDEQLIERARSGFAAPARPGRSDCPHPKARVHKGLCGACGTGGLGGG